MSTAAAAAVIGAALLGAAPANAQGFSIGIAPGGVGFSYDSGGYCDDYGCPDDFWDYPLYYCPVYFRGQWYDGPVYYRQDGDEYWYWIHGNWRRDQWNGARPQWACFDRYGPPLGLDFYESHGFRIRSEWMNQWSHDRNHNHGLWNGQTHSYDWKGSGGTNWSNQWLGQHGNDHGNWNGNVRGWNGGNNQGGSQNNQIKLLGTPGKPPGWSGGYNGSHDHGTVHLYNNGFIGGNGGNPGNGNQGSGNSGGSTGNGGQGGGNTGGNGIEIALRIAGKNASAHVDRRSDAVNRDGEDEAGKEGRGQDACHRVLKYPLHYEKDHRLPDEDGINVGRESRRG